jgi:hypothetical protein
LRNPDSKSQLAVVDLKRQLELPSGSARRYAARPVWGGGEVMNFDADHPATVTLAPFQVLTFELTPQ